ncbi:hypothetical protein CPB97_000540 [Podila verticillata]|nr:hypothetical protein CPB97_000540 [Podila verticillata]
MASTTVFDIHHLQDAICHGLSTRDIRRCMLVCRCWHTNFEPYLWRYITVRKRLTFNKIKSDLIQSKLARNASNILSIDSIFADIWPIFQNVPINNLTVLKSPSLSTRIANLTNNQKYAPQTIDLIIASPNLQVLETSFLGHSDKDSKRFIMAIQNHVNLRELSVVAANSVYCKTIRLLLFSCGNLEKVHIQAYIYGYRQAETPDRDMQDLLAITGSRTPSFRIKELSFKCQECYSFNYCLIPTLRLCHRLERLAAPRLHYLTGYSEIADVLSATTTLQHLDMSAIKTLGSHAVLFINACVGLRSYRGAFHHTGVKDVYEALLQHWKTLEALDLAGTGADTAASTMMQRVLSRCPNLEQFLAMGPLKRIKPSKASTDGDPVLEERDMVGLDASLNWVCDRLRVLKLQFRARLVPGNAGGSNMPVIPEQLVAELSRLTQLEDLRLGWVRHRDERPIEELAASEIEAGQKSVSKLLDVLSKLTGLKRLELRGFKAFVNKEALKKARGQWKHCEWVQYS